MTHDTQCTTHATLHQALCRRRAVPCQPLHGRVSCAVAKRLPGLTGAAINHLIGRKVSRVRASVFGINRSLQLSWLSSERVNEWQPSPIGSRALKAAAQIDRFISTMSRGQSAHLSRSPSLALALFRALSRSLHRSLPLTHIFYIFLSPSSYPSCCFSHPHPLSLSLSLSLSHPFYSHPSLSSTLILFKSLFALLPPCSSFPKALFEKTQSSGAG